MTVTASLQAQLAAFLPLATMLFFRRRRVAACAVAGGLLLAIAGCGYHANQVAVGEAAAAHTAGSYPITITATSGTLVHTAVVTVNVQ
jgi:phosphoheptose isomerase